MTATETEVPRARAVAVVVGVLYIVATAAPVSTLGAWATLTEGSGILANAAENEGALIQVALLNLLMAIAVAGVALVLYPILTRVADTALKQGLAAWYVGTRLTESALFVMAVALTVAFLPMSREFLAADDSAAGVFQANAEVLQSLIDVTWVLGQTVFAVGAAMLYYLLFASRLVPRWLSGWGLASAPLFLVGSLSLLWTWNPDSTLSSALYAPMAAQEMVMAVWLIVRGFTFVGPVAGAEAPCEQGVSLRTPPSSRQDSDSE